MKFVLPLVGLVATLIVDACAVMPIGRSRVSAAEAGAIVPQSGADQPSQGCPYDFSTAMPAATFCVYRGIALGPDGDVCADDVLVIWSSYSVDEIEQQKERLTPSPPEVYFGFVADPELVLRALVDPKLTTRAVMVGYTLGDGQSPIPLAGETKLGTTVGAQPDNGILTIRLDQPHRLRATGCALSSYAGSFVGIVRLPPGDDELIESRSDPKATAIR